VTKLVASSRNRVTMPGGTIYREQNIVAQSYDDDAIGHFWGQKLFTGCYGLNRFGLMETDPLIVQAEMKLAESRRGTGGAGRQPQAATALLHDRRRTRSNLDPVTDAGASEEDLEPLRSAGIRVIKVAVPTEQEAQKSTSQISA